MIETDAAEAMIESLGVLDTLKLRASVRNFSDHPVPDAVLMDILNAARQAPTSSNLQAYSIVVVRDAEKHRRLSQLAGNQKHITQAPVFAAFCADLNRLGRIGARSGQVIDAEGMELCLVSVIDAALACMCASLAADSLGMGSVMIGGMRNDPEAVAETLRLPEGVFVPFGLCLGWPLRNPPPKPRLNQQAVIHFESYDAAAALDAPLDAYDADLNRYHLENGLNPQIWSRRIGTSLATRHRAGLSEALRKRGFPFR